MKKINIKNIKRDHMINLSKLIIFIGLAKFIGAYKEIIIAEKYGITDKLDIFNFIINSTNILAGVLMSALSLSLASLFGKPAEDRQLLFQEIGGLFIIIGIVSAVIIAWVAATRQSPDPAVATLLLSCMIIPSCFAALLATILLLEGGHLNSLLECVPALTLVIGLLIWAPLDPVQLALAATTGALMQCLALYFFARRTGLVGLPSLSFRSYLWRDFSKIVTLVSLAQVFMAVISLGDNYLLVKAGPGASTEFNFASRAVSIALSIVGLTINRIALPAFAKDAGNFPKSALGWSAAICFFLCLALTAAYPYRFEMIQVLYQRGAFGPTEVVRVTRLASLLALQIPFYAGGAILVAAFSSAGRYWPIVITAAVAVIVKLAIYTICKWNISTSIVAISTAAIYVINFLIYFMYTITSSRSESPSTIKKITLI